MVTNYISEHELQIALYTFIFNLIYVQVPINWSKMNTWKILKLERQTQFRRIENKNKFLQNLMT